MFPLCSLLQCISTNITLVIFLKSFPDGSVGKESTYSAETQGDAQFNSESGRSPGRRKWQHTQYFMKNSHEKPGGWESQVIKSQETLSDWTHNTSRNITLIMSVLLKTCQWFSIYLKILKSHESGKCCMVFSCLPLSSLILHHPLSLIILQAYMPFFSFVKVPSFFLPQDIWHAVTFA